MPEYIITYGLEMIGFLFISLVMLLALNIIRLHRSLAIQQSRIKELKNDMQALLLCSRGVGEKILSHQKELNVLRKSIDSDPEPQDPGYKQAIALMKLGASEIDTINTCDLTRGEVELIAHLQKASH